jgi:hypothetical protein
MARASRRLWFQSLIMKNRQPLFIKRENCNKIYVNMHSVARCGNEPNRALMYLYFYRSHSPQKGRVLYKLFSMASGECLAGPRYVTIS